MYMQRSNTFNITIVNRAESSSYCISDLFKLPYVKSLFCLVGGDR